MGNVYGAAAGVFFVLAVGLLLLLESKMQRNGREEDIDLNHEFVFSIPIYDNLPTYNNESHTVFPDPKEVGINNNEEFNEIFNNSQHSLNNNFGWWMPERSLGRVIFARAGKDRHK